MNLVPDRLKRWTVALALFSLLCALGLMATDRWFEAVELPLLLHGYLVLILATSVLSFVVYGIDKMQAVRSNRRIPEKTLHFLAWCGGWPGAIFGQETFRHKTAKQSFRNRFWAIVAVHLAVIGVCLYLWCRRASES
ncbi:MAG: DUF1294 domain-containing protein [Planctomycetota bacterium]|nr:DUF1294 domain-containing protein [Planctomycetota bacterium]